MVELLMTKQTALNFTTDIWQPVMGTLYPKKNGVRTPYFQDIGVGPGGFISGPASMAKTVWSGLGTTGKVGVGVIGGAVAYGTYDWLFGGTKKDAAPQEQKLQQEQKQTQQIPINLDYKYNYSPTDIINNTWNDYSTLIISNSPGSGITKKDSFVAETPISQNPVTPFSFSVTPSQEQAQKADQAQAQGTDFTTLAIIGAVGLVAYGFVSKPTSKRRK
jgi:hypothetical protein